MHSEIYEFNPDVEVLKIEHQDFLNSFNAGGKFINFNDFIKNDASEYAENGDGVTYLVFNNKDDNRDLVAYYTLATTAIPYIDRIRYDAEEQKKYGREFDDQIWGIWAIEIRMFAVDINYQDIFYRFEDECLPISVWILNSIIDYAHSLIDSIVGIKALFLHATPNAERFYYKNKFNYIEKNMKPLQCVDSDCQSMYHALKKIHMNFDE